MKIRQRSSSFYFLSELLFVILCFALGSVLCVRLFALASAKHYLALDQNQALRLAQPLAEQLLGQARDLPDPLTLAAGFADPARGVETPEDALAGAKDIIAEWISDDAGIRKRLRVVTMAQGELVSKAAKPEEESVYEPYYDFRQPLR